MKVKLLYTARVWGSNSELKWFPRALRFDEEVGLPPRTPGKLKIWTLNVLGVQCDSAVLWFLAGFAFRVKIRASSHRI